MKVTQPPPGSRKRPGLPLWVLPILALLAFACSKKGEDAKAKPETPTPSVKVPAAPPEQPAPEPEPEPEPDPVVEPPAPVVEAPKPKPARKPAVKAPPAEPVSAPEPVPVEFTLGLKPLPAQVDKGDTVLFDLGPSKLPTKAVPQATLRFDFEGDGTWDTPELPFAGNAVRKHAYPAVGRYKPRIEARLPGAEPRSVEGAIAVIGAVDARLTLQPDTVDPGGKVSVDASGSKGDGRLAYALDLDGDGKIDWADSTSGKATLKAPASGRYEARLTARNPMGQEGKATAPLLVNARVRAALRLKAAKAHMAEPIEAAIEAVDADDSLRALRINFTGAPDAWTAVSAPDSAKGPGRWRKVFRQAYGKPGRFTVEGCALSADGRADCRKAQVEIYNAPPVCKPGPDLKAILGVPAEIEGAGEDPDGSIVKWEWDLDGDGKYDVASKKDGKVKYTFSRKGTFALNLKVTTADGMTATGSRKVEVRKP